ncbi:hypothetical protein ABZ490_09465 [Streptomyces sp. NPDC005811]|uniref:hypothetical protein n=1 Tax=Streptomyces sp. NPDC005811 TaxID=3154565 RepID=UPI00340E53F0
MNLRLLALGGAVACALAVPLAMASAGQVGDAPDGGTDPKAPAALPAPSPAPPAGSSPLLLGLGLATAARCGPGLTSPEGVEAQTCLLTQGGDTWARTYYRNATGRALDAVLSLMAPEGRTVRMRCAVAAEDEPETCETPREPTRGTLDAYTAVAEFSAFAGKAGEGPLLLRSGSNSPGAEGS